MTSSNSQCEMDLNAEATSHTKWKI